MPGKKGGCSGQSGAKGRSDQSNTVGQGRGQGLGPKGNCQCLGCGYKAPHRPGKPCKDMRCPHCGSNMTRG